MSDESNFLEPSKPEKATEAVLLALAAVPYAGSVLSTAASLFLHKRQNRRLQRFLKSLANDLESVKREMHQQFIQSESFTDLAEDIISKASEIQQQEKLDALREGFLHAVIHKATRHDKAAEISDAVRNIGLKCLGHNNEYEHFDPGMPTLVGYDLGIKFYDDESPPPFDLPLEPRLYLYISIKELKSRHNFGTLHYARSRINLQNGFPSSEADRELLRAEAISRLHSDIEVRVKGQLPSSNEQPIFI